MAQTDLQIEEIKLSEITPDPGQPRKLMDESALCKLADSIKEHGVIQPTQLGKRPPPNKPDDAGLYTLLDKTLPGVR